MSLKKNLNRENNQNKQKNKLKTQNNQICSTNT